MPRVPYLGFGVPSLHRCSGYRSEALGFRGSQVWQPTVLQVHGELSITSLGREGGGWGGGIHKGGMGLRVRSCCS